MEVARFEMFLIAFIDRLVELIILMITMKVADRCVLIVVSQMSTLGYISSWKIFVWAPKLG